MLKKFLVLLLLCPVGLLANAQQRSAEIAERLVTVMQLDKIMKNIRTSMIPVLSKSIPEDKQEGFKQAATEFFEIAMNWKAVKPEFIKIYQETFTDDELVQLATFYESPIGKKMLEKSPELMRKGMEIGHQLVLRHQDELQTLMQKYLKNEE